jgi:hypothetical protein
MTQLYQQRASRGLRPAPDESTRSEPASAGGRSMTLARVLGALAILAVGAVHLEQYFAVHFEVVPIIGPLFALNFAGATVIGLGLLLPLVRPHLLQVLLALGGIGLAATSFVFLFVSEHQPLFGFEDYGYRPAILTALAAEGAAVIFLGVYLVARTRRG